MRTSKEIEAISIGALFIGFILGAIIAGWITIAVVKNPGKQIKEVITQCELSLPRTEHCVLTAVPAGKE
jgi:hypothetical protein